MSTQTIVPPQAETVMQQAPEEEKPKSKIDVAKEASEMGFHSAQAFTHLQRVAGMFAHSDLVPDAFKGNIANCSIAVNLARRLGADELMVLQNLFVVYGRPGWSAKFKIAMFNHTGQYTPIAYEFFGEKGKDNYGCRAKCIYKATGEEVVGPDITIALAKAEGWYDRKSKSGGPASKWPTMTDLMLRYRAASWMIDTTAPELTMGLGTVEELIDTGQLVETIIQNTEQRLAEKRMVQTAAEKAVSESPNALEALMAADKAKKEAQKVNSGAATENAPEPTSATPDKPPSPAATASPEQPKSTGRGRSRAPASTPPGPAQSNPSYAVGADPDPFAEGGSLFGQREPGCDDN